MGSFMWMEFQVAESLWDYWYSYCTLVWIFPMQVAQCLGECFLFYSQSMGIAKNMTTLEQMDAQYEGEDFNNQWDTGAALTNVQDYFGFLGRDWANEFAVEV